jgi:hypothetical protein
MSRETREPAWLETALRELADSEALQQAPPRVEQSLRAALRVRPERRHRAPALWWLAAAAATLAAWSVLKQETVRPPQPAYDAADAGEYLALVEGEPSDELDAVQVVRVRLPGSALARLGAPLAPVGAEPVEAEVIVGQDGVARGIRFVE